jgi:hypothetical protein
LNHACQVSLYGRALENSADTTVQSGRLKEPFRAADVNQVLGITYAGTFLPKHRRGNPGRNTVLFVQVDRDLYRLAEAN